MDMKPEELLRKEYERGYADAMGWKLQNHLEHLPPEQATARQQEEKPTTREEILSMAREAGLAHSSFCRWSAYTDDLERFAALVAAAEREACAKVFDEMADQMVADMEPSTAVFWVRSKAAEIRARGD